MPINLEKYLSYLEDFDLSHAEKEEIICVIWQMMEARVDIAFNEHPVQQICGQKKNKTSHKGQNRLDSNEPSISSNYREAANEAGSEIKGGYHVA